MSSNLVSWLTVGVLTIALFIGGLGVGIVISGREGPAATSTVTTTTTTSATNSSVPYVLTLVVSINNLFNSSASDQPAFYVLGPNGLRSSASISVPVHRQIELVIINYDDGNATMVQSNDNVVAGTVGNTIRVESNANINSTQGGSGITIRGEQTLSSVDPQILAHTFSVSSLGLNVPLPVSSTVVAFFTINQAGTYVWQCMTLCGPAAMSTPGWMTGQLVAS